VRKERYRRGKHSVAALYVHLVFVVKYRRAVLTPEVRERLAEVFRDTARKMHFEVVEVNGEQDHLHLLIEFPPKHSVSNLVNHLKGASSRAIRQEFGKLASSKYLWSPSYFAVTCGGAPIEKIKEYIENQGSK